MRRYSHFVHTLTAAFLAGPWSAEGLEVRGRVVLGRRNSPRWLIRLSTRLVARFGTQPPLPTAADIARFLAAKLSVDRQWAASPRMSLLRLPPLEMQPSVLPAPIGIPPLETPGKLAEWLELTPEELDWFADRHGRERHTPAGPLRHYRYRLLQKTSGRIRVLEVPKPRLKAMQRKILHELLEKIPAHSAAHGFCAGRSTATCVAPHAGRDLVVRFDLRDFFPSIRASRVNALLRSVGYPEPVAQLLTGLCTNSTPEDVLASDEMSTDATALGLYRQPHLPQGAPTSPALANLCAFRLDRRLAALAERFGATYTRYADDLLFSGDGDLERGLSRFKTLALAIALDEGFPIRSHKTQVMRRHQRQRALGVVLNQHPNPPRREFDSLRALLFNCVRQGPAAQNRAGVARFREHLLGRIGYFAMLNADRARKLQALFERIDWSR
jgi:hypothetical protein